MKKIITKGVFKLAIGLLKLGFRISGDMDVFGDYDMAIISKAMKDKYIKSEKGLRPWKYRGLRSQIRVVNKRVQQLYLQDKHKHI